MKHFIGLLTTCSLLASCGTSNNYSEVSPHYTQLYYDDEEVSPLSPGSTSSSRLSILGSSSIMVDGQDVSDAVEGGNGFDLNSATSVRGNSTAAYRLENSATNYANTDEVAQPAHPRIVSYTANLLMIVDSTDTSIALLQHIARLYNGYVLRSSNHFVSLRIPASRFEDALSNIEGIGTVKDKNVYGKDISDEYYDTETRLANAENARKRYLELLAKSENVEAGLKVEKELERLNGEIELLKGRIARLKEITSLATIHVNLRERNPKNVSRPGPLGYVFVGLYQAVKWLFVWE